MARKRVDVKAAADTPTIGKDRLVLRILVLEGLANLVVLALKLVVGISTGSLAIIGDAVHSLTDVTNNVVAAVVVRMSAKPADRNHPYGHRKFETLAVFGLAALLTVLALELAIHALRRDTVVVTGEPWELMVMVLVLCLNIGLALWQRWWAKRLGSDILLADASHTFADVLTTVAVIIGWQVAAAGYAWLDTAAALCVSGLVFYLALQLFNRVVPILVDAASVEPAPLLDKVSEIDGVQRVRRLRSRWIGSAPAVDMIVEVDAELSTAQSHAIADAIEDLLAEHFEVNDVSIHIEPSES